MLVRGIQEGQFYRMQSGAVVGPMCKEFNADGNYFAGRVTGEFVAPDGQVLICMGSTFYFLPCGTYNFKSFEPRAEMASCDLVSRIVPRIAAGRRYRLRDGGEIPLRAFRDTHGSVFNLYGYPSGIHTTYAERGVRGAELYPPGTNGAAEGAGLPFDLVAEILDGGVEIPLPPTWEGMREDAEIVADIAAAPMEPAMIAAIARKNKAEPTEGRIFRTVHTLPAIRTFVTEADAWFARGCTGAAPAGIFYGVELETQHSPKDDEGSYEEVDGWQLGTDGTVDGVEYRFENKAGWDKAVARIGRVFQLDHDIDEHCSFHIHTSIAGATHVYGERFQRRLMGALLSRIRDIPTNVLTRWRDTDWMEEYFEFKVVEEKYTAVSLNGKFKTWEFRAFGNVGNVADGLRCMELATWCLAAAYSTMIIPAWEQLSVGALANYEVERRERGDARVLALA